MNERAYLWLINIAVYVMSIKCVQQRLHLNFGDGFVVLGAHVVFSGIISSLFLIISHLSFLHQFVMYLPKIVSFTISYFMAHSFLPHFSLFISRYTSLFISQHSFCLYV